MQISGIVFKIFEESEKDDLTERIIRIRSFEKNQELDIYAYNKLAFRTGFLNVGEQVTFELVLRGIPVGKKQETQIVLAKPIKPDLILTKDHPIEGVEWIRRDSSQERQNKK
ncbi:flagellar biosynthetic protein FlhB [Chryseobacterium sp. StRB126]|uniref:hypothetical protein n=1 Tax=Chryseobacterium sp. StRB126 TaxID=878220 RepID=UPI0004E993D7|nr:hypothetical protein [Chryseobacterium sp. StRB126]BAP30162.1 flagellar biosynthetic protein FlhB [Chryseobacterium sp. StRB126]